MGKRYKATEGAQFNQHDAQVYGECLDKISEKRNGTLKPIDVVEEARKRNSPLHKYFEWDNIKASEKFRVEQARHLINHITVIIRYDHKIKEQRAFFSVNRTPYGDEKNNKNKIYVTVERVLSEPELRQQVLNNALNEAEYWTEKYHQYTELSKIFKAIKETKRKLKVKAKKKR